MEILDERFLMIPWDYYTLLSPNIYIDWVMEFMYSAWPNCLIYSYSDEFPAASREDIDNFVMDRYSHTQVQDTLLHIFSDSNWLNRTNPNRDPGTTPSMPNLSIEDHFFCSLFVWKHGLSTGYEILHPDLTTDSDFSVVDSEEGDMTDAHGGFDSPDPSQ
jgi:hypothetical protein